MVSEAQIAPTHEVKNLRTGFAPNAATVGRRVQSTAQVTAPAVPLAPPEREGQTAAHPSLGSLSPIYDRSSSGYGTPSETGTSHSMP